MICVYAAASLQAHLPLADWDWEALTRDTPEETDLDPDELEER